ncbi:MAG: polyprenyl diphosphate synthase [Proteobacteria bacterium]|jgi:undecaprenyl diphosphate synthase|nr:polyprenyl diphosphate synthase [Pseudomonadota bacterium]
MVKHNNLYPQHVAIIMDGNRRWARNNKVSIAFGHESGSKRVNDVIDFSNQIGIKYLTLFAFSSENWKRSESEIQHLKFLLTKFINDYQKDLIDRNVRFRSIGHIESFGQELMSKLFALEESTSMNDGLFLNVALSYGGRQEILNAVNKMLSKGLEGNVDEKMFEKFLDTVDIPDPDLLIRTGGEVRISNFLLWQIAYTELYFTDIYWPDFGIEAYQEAIEFFQSRSRRYGGD